MKPLAIQMGNGNSSDGKYSQVARMALSHPVLPIQPPEPKSEEQYGSHSHIYDRYICKYFFCGIWFTFATAIWRDN